MASAVLKALDSSTFEDGNLWELGVEKNWEELQTILAPVTGDDFAVTELTQRLLIDDVRQKFDSAKDSHENTILSRILLTNAADKIKMLNVAAVVMSVGVHPDVPAADGWRPAHIVGQEALVELVSTIYACRPDMAALNSNNLTPLTAAQAAFVRGKPQHPFNAHDHHSISQPD